jgi:hypothetical protein
MRRSLPPPIQGEGIFILPLSILNRWRMQDYVNLLEKIGWEIFHTDFRPGDVAAVQATSLAEPWSGRTAEEVAISHCYLGMQQGA